MNREGLTLHTEGETSQGSNGENKLICNKSKAPYF